jgi:hypothetical protein
MSTLDNQILTLDLHGPRTHRPLSWPAKDGTGGHVELAAMTGACHRGAIQLALRQRASSVSTRIIEGIESAAGICDVYLRSADIKNTHRPGDDILRGSNSHGHDSPLLRIDVGTGFSPSLGRAEARPHMAARSIAHLIIIGMTGSSRAGLRSSTRVVPTPRSACLCRVACSREGLNTLAAPRFPAPHRFREGRR